MTLKVKFADFEQITRSRSFVSPISRRVELETAALALLAPILPVKKGVRLLGVTLSSLCADDEVKSQLGFDLM